MSAATTEVQKLKAEVQKLKQIALERYEMDGGTMFECTDSAAYVDLIIKHGTAEAAWAAELDGYAIREAYATECRAAYEF